jgi:hypothetical protein
MVYLTDKYIGWCYGIERIGRGFMMSIRGVVKTLAYRLDNCLIIHVRAELPRTSGQSGADLGENPHETRNQDPDPDCRHRGCVRRGRRPAGSRRRWRPDSYVPAKNVGMWIPTQQLTMRSQPETRSDRKVTKVTSGP